MAGITTHVLDTARGIGAGGMQVDLRRLAPEPGDPVTVTLDAGGRATLLPAGAVTAGRYELRFHVAAYQAAAGDGLAAGAAGAWPFLSVVPVVFGVGDPAAHYHVPLILSPFGYSTYRGG